jgi:hypothetical protein
MRYCIWTFILLSFLIAGCSCSEPKLRATWYILDGIDAKVENKSVEKDKNEKNADGNENDRREMYVAILNEGPRKISIKKIIVNATGDDTGDGWELKKPKTLDTGQMILQKLTDFEREGMGFWPTVDKSCRVPVTVFVEENPNCLYKAEIVGTIPSAIPLYWEQQCSTDQ